MNSYFHKNSSWSYTMNIATLDIIAQIGVSIFGLLAILLISLENKWGFVAGLFGQPFWYITTYLNHQWGIFLLTIVYTAMWMFGCYKWFRKKGGMIQIN